MKKSYFLLLFFLGIKPILAQVGINTTTPNAQLEIKSSDQAAPSNTDGILIPKVDVFPATNPTSAQQGMLVYLTTTSGTNMPGFYYWDNSGTPSWTPITGSSGSTLDQAYDFGGAGNGKTIIADAGALTIDGTDGFVSTGTINTGAVAPSGGGVKMFWNPRKAAFRSGRVFGNQWDDINIGLRSIASGDSNIASGISSTAFGGSTVASGSLSTAFGQFSNASGYCSTVFGASSSAIGIYSFALGLNNEASGYSSIAAGFSNAAASYGETVLGIGATIYTPSTNGATKFATANATDRLLVVGNAIDINNNDSIDSTERSDALIILKNGLTRLPSTTNAMINAADGKAVVTKEYLQNTTGTLDQAYDFGGAGNGKTITADTGAVTIDGTDGLVSTGVYTSGAIAPSGPGTRMVWNPRKAAFRAGDVDGTQWDDENIGIRSVAFGLRTIASGNSSSAFGQLSVASGAVATAFGRSTASGLFSTSFGQLSIASGDVTTAFGRSTASGLFSTSFGYLSTASGEVSTASGEFSTASGLLSNANGYLTTASGVLSNSFGYGNFAKSYAETVFGVGATDYTPTVNGAIQVNAPDRLFVIGNAIDTNDNDIIDASERSDALVILKNGNAGFGSSTPQEKLHVVGNIRIVDGNQATGKILTCDANGTATWQNPAVNAWGLLGNFGSNAATNFIGTTDNQSLAFRTNNIERARILTTGEFGIGTTTPSRKLHVADNTASTTNGQLYIEQSGTGDALMHFGNTSLRHFNMGLDTSADAFKISTSATAPGAVSSSTLMNLQSTGELGLGTVTPDRKLEVSGTGTQYARITSTSSLDVGIELKRLGSDWQMRNDTGDLVFAQSNDDFATVTDVVRVGGGSFTPVTDNAIPLGQSIRRWTSVHAVNGVIQTSDANDKKEMLPLSYGLEKIKSLRPISFQWKDAKIDNSSTHLGFVAQEVQQVLPEIVVDHDWKELPESQEKTWEETEKLGMKYAEIIPVLVKAVQEQQVIIEELKTKIEALEKK